MILCVSEFRESLLVKHPISNEYRAVNSKNIDHLHVDANCSAILDAQMFQDSVQDWRDA